MRFDIVQGDLIPPIGVVLGGSDSLASANFVVFTMAQVDGAKRVSAHGVIDDATKRTAHYDWQAGDTDVAGVYRAQWQVMYPGAEPETYPSNDTLWVVIRPRL